MNDIYFEERINVSREVVDEHLTYGNGVVRELHDKMKVVVFVKEDDWDVEQNDVQHTKTIIPFISIRIAIEEIIESIIGVIYLSSKRVEVAISVEGNFNFEMN